MSLARRLAAGAAVTAIAAAATLATAAAAGAAAPQDLDGFVTDIDGALTSSEEQSLEARLAELASSERFPELYVVFADEFDSPSDGLEWVAVTADDALLGSNQYLLAVATEQRDLAISSPDDGPLSQRRVDEILDTIASRHFSREEWAEGVELAADEFEELPAPWWAWLILFAGIALAVAVVVLLVRWIRTILAHRAELRTLEGQRHRAARELVRADAAVRNSEQELDFVTAEFGEDTTAPFRTAATRAREQVARGFELQRLLEDAEPDTISQTRAWTNEILELCRGVHRELDGKRGALRTLRDLVHNADAAVTRLTELRLQADDLVASASDRLETLRAAFPASDVALVADNDAEMRRRLAHADEWLERLREAAASRRGGAIARAVHEIEDDLAEVRELHDDVVERGRALDARGASAHRDDPLPLFAMQARRSPVDTAGAVVRGTRVDIEAAATPPADETAMKTQLSRAEAALADAETTEDPAAAERLALRAIEHAERARRFGGLRPSPFARTPARYLPPRAASARPTPLRRAAPRTVYEDEDSGRGFRAVFGGFGGAVVGGFGGATTGDGEAGPIVLGLLIGLVVGALSGAFGDSEGGSSSSGGWGSNSSGGSRSPRSSGRSRSSSGGSRSSSRGGGRRSSGRSF